MKRFSTRKCVVLCSVSIAVIVCLAAATVLTSIFAQRISDHFNQDTSVIINAGEPIYTSSFSSPAKVLIHDEAVCRDIESEGIVMLRNADLPGTGTPSLPLEKESDITVLGRASVDLLYDGTDSASTAVSDPLTLLEALEESGFDVNPYMADFYKSGAGSRYDRSIPATTYAGADSFVVGEVPASEYTDMVIECFDGYLDAAIVVISRSGSDYTDLPTERNSAGKYYLELNNDELDLLRLARRHFANVVLLINSSQPLMLGGMETAEYCPDSILWIGNPGRTGTRAIGRVLNGYVTPSGHLTETWAYDHMSAPSSQTFGASRYIWQSGAPESEFNYYTVLSEGIYTGYRYYETRYEDRAMSAGNAGDYSYADTVMYPFGYGLSYTEFTYVGFMSSYDEQTDEYRFTIIVVNSGDVAGKDTVQLYMQSPYTEYDRSVGIERASVELVGYAKTDTLQPQSSDETTIFYQTVNITVSGEQLRVYDSAADGGQGGYITEGGEYYFTVATDSHAAVNNIIAYKQENGIADYNESYLSGYDGAKSSFVAAFTVAEDLPETSVGDADAGSDGENSVSVYDAAGTSEARNRFAYADIKTYDNSFRYLTRSDWEGTFPEAGYSGSSWTVDRDTENRLIGYMSPSGRSAFLGEAVAEGSSYVDEDQSGTFGENSADETASENSQLSAFDLIGAKYGDERYSDLADMLQTNEKADFIRMGGYTINALSKPAMPGTKCRDGVTGIIADISTSSPAMSYPTPAVVAATWNDELAETLGECISEDSLTTGVSGVFSPCLNVRRSVFHGKNYSSFGEDPLLVGRMGAAEVRGIRTKMGIAFIGNYALDVQVSYSAGLSVYADEQTIRSIYLRPFEIAVKDGNTTAVMQSAVRLGPVWVGASRALMTEVLREEWGFCGMTLTSRYGNDTYMRITSGLAAGTDMWFNDNYAAYIPSLTDFSDSVMSGRLNQAVANIMYTVISSNSMNGITAETRVESVLPEWQIAYIVIASLLFAGAVALLIVVLVNRAVTKSKNTSSTITVTWSR